MIGRLMFAIVDCAARKGLADPGARDSAKQRARRTGIRGETYAYWYLRRHAYVLSPANDLGRISTGAVSGYGALQDLGEDALSGRFP